MTRPLPVAIALVSRQGMYLIRQRPALPGSPMPGFWEFPGGKCEPGESPADAALRECWEEAGVKVVLSHERRVITHQYPHGLVELHYLDCVLADDSACPSAGSGFVWVAAGELPALRFPEANGPILTELAAEARERLEVGRTLAP